MGYSSSRILFKRKNNQKNHHKLLNKFFRNNIHSKASIYNNPISKK